MNREAIKPLALGALTGLVIGCVLLLLAPKADKQGGGTQYERIPETPTATVAHAATQTPTTAPTEAQERVLTPTATNTPSPTVTPEITPVNAVQRKADVDGTHGWKPWAWYTACNDTRTPQWRLQQIAATDNKGRRIVQDPNGEWRFCVALPVYWAGGHAEDIGKCFDLVMANGAILKCVLGDTKKIEHSVNGEGRYGVGHNEMVEVQVDGTRLCWDVAIRGDASWFGDEWQGDVERVIVYDMYIEGFGG